MTTFLVFLAVLAAGAVALAATGLPLRRTGSAADPDTADPAAAAQPGPGAAGTGDPGLAEPDPRLPPVLLPDHVQASDIGRLRFSVGLRGYRMDQVDEVLAKLATALAERDAELAALHGRSAHRRDDPEARS
ncbi:DivIVA domain-containing protein [Arthrobacter citreus]|uniref:DivIVA domain-containing protein n=1 Tax=Arthrobacter TaxID=1663 RepID=UPI0012647289|nr:DivIVA domain-containing protein [Arthrobacter gandavensis]